MKKAVILEIVVTKNQILPCQFEGDIWTTVRRIVMLIMTPEGSRNRKRNWLVFFAAAT